MNAMLKETEAEKRAIGAVKAEVQRRLDDNDEAAAEIAEQLGLFPAGLDSMMMRSWSLSDAFRIADALDIDFAQLLRQ